MISFRPGFKCVLSFALACSSILTPAVSLAISKEMHALVRMETHSNAVASRESDFTRLEHYEIPMSLVEADVARRSNPAFVKSLIFEKNGQKYLRWIINPEDTKWYKEVEALLIQNGIKPERKTYFVGYMTASRSYIAVDPKSGAEFSFKGSTDHTGGAWRDKHQTWDDGKQIRSMTDFVTTQLKAQPKLENIILLDEPMAFGLIGEPMAGSKEPMDQGMVIRSYEEIKGTGHRYVPGFSIMHEKLGVELAKANGSNDPAKYWNENYNKPLARALAEFLALTGMTYDSPHSQNFLVELDEKNRPTGKIVLRDFGDTYLSDEFFKAVQRTDISSKWDQDNLKKGKMSVAVGILHGNKAPSWMDTQVNSTEDKSYDQWGRDFFVAFEKEFVRQTGLKLSPLYDVYNMGMYREKSYSMTDDAAQKFMNLAAQGRQRENLKIRTCGYAFAM